MRLVKLEKSLVMTINLFIIVECYFFNSFCGTKMSNSTSRSLCCVVFGY